VGKMVDINMVAHAHSLYGPLVEHGELLLGPYDRYIFIQSYDLGHVPGYVHKLVCYYDFGLD